MTRNDKIQVEAEPTLFDGLEPQETAGNGQETTEPKTREWLAERVAAISKGEALRAGIWQVIPSAALILRGETYYNLRVGTITEKLKQSGMTDNAVNTVLGDYVGALNGVYIFEATPKQMQQALKALKPYVAFNIDRYGLYLGLLMNYSRFLLRLHEYTEAVKGEDATEQTKRAYIDAYYPATDAMAIKWLLAAGYVEPSDFAGFDPSEMGRFWGRVQELAGLGEYSTYYTIARLALAATPEELADVEAPPFLNTTTPIAKLCEQAVQETAEILNRAAEKFAAAAADTEQEREQARRAGNSWQDDTNRQIIKRFPSFNSILSRPVNLTKGKNITDVLPIQARIDDFKRNEPSFNNVNITPMTIQKVFEGVSLLPTYLQKSMKVENGRYSYHTNISEFAEICGYVDASQPQKLALLGGLKTLHNVYFIVQRPYKIVERTTAKGIKKTKKTGGVTAMQFLSLRQYDETGDLFIEVYPESLQGHPTLITADIFKRLRDRSKGLAQSRFNYHITEKSHKSENDLIDDCFGFADMLRHASDDELPKVKKYIRSNRSARRREMLGWFADYVEQGILTEYKREPSKTQKGDFVLSWVCVKPEEIRPTEQLIQEPDEQ